MPSDTVMVLNNTPLPPAASAPASASVARSLMWILQGVRLAQVEATPICGFWKSASWNPTARSIARDGDCFAPSTTSREYCRGSTVLLFFAFIVCVVPLTKSFCPQVCLSGSAHLALHV